MLIHSGINTVQLNGKYFNPKVAPGDIVKPGDLLVEFDLENIKEAGFEVTTPVIITNSDSYLEVVGTEEKNIKAEETLVTLIV